MTKIYVKLYFAIYMLAFAAGFIFLCGGMSALPAGVSIDGVEVGGMTRACAVAAVREDVEKRLKEKKLEIRADSEIYTFIYPEINYRDELKKVVSSIKKSGSYSGGVRYYLCGENEVISGICAAQSVAVEEPYAEFSPRGAPFSYFEGRDGRVADGVALRVGVEKALTGGFEPVTLTYKRVNRKKTMQDVRAETQLLSSFSTYFDDTNYNRSLNIALAAESLNGRVIAGGGILSFNEAVGERTAERGYLPAKIIEGGEYVEGLGGGVCQVSTTLYNSALLSGLKIDEYHPHTLAVGYVAPSRDAMVSGRTFDLKIVNSGITPVYIRTKACNGSVSVNIYGKSSGETYSIESVVSGGIAAPEEFTDDETKVREGRDGILSESYLVAKKGGDVRKVRLRHDKYSPIKRVVLRRHDYAERDIIFNPATPVCG